MFSTMKGSLVLVSFLMSLALAKGDDLSSEYNNFAALDEDSKILLYWSVNASASTIQFAVEAKTTGWVGFGISSGQGKMKGADIVIGWVKDGKPYFSDRHAVGHSLPIKDDSQDYELAGSEEKDGKTTLKFKRKLDTCDPNDNKIQEGTTKVIFAFNSEDPDSEESMRQHLSSNRGAKSLKLLTKPKIYALPSNLSYFDIRNNETHVLQEKTTYWCKPIEIPQPPSKRHVVMIEPIIQKGNEGLVHHMLVYECRKDFPRNNLTGEGQCYADNLAPAVAECQAKSTIYGWAIGSGKYYLPDNVGFPHGEENQPRIVVLQTHYDNPEKKSGLVDSSGLRFWFTEKLREHDAGLIEVGVTTSPRAILIPPKQKGWQSTGYCPGICTKEGIQNSALPSGGINVFATFLHTHLAGRAVRVRHVRNGIELPNIARDDNYDFNFQEYQAARKEIPVLPGDEILTTCSYDTMDRNDLVRGGLATTEEMCLAFIFYYPKQNLTSCLSADFGAYIKYNTYKALYKPTRWDTALANVLRKFYDKSENVVARCSGRNEAFLPGLGQKTVRKTVITKAFQPEKTCEEPGPVAKATSIILTTRLLVLGFLFALGNQA